jgi:hypothetical protein
MKLSQTEETLALAAAKAGMDEKTARKWRKMGLSPSEAKRPRMSLARWTGPFRHADLAPP